MHIVIADDPTDVLPYAWTEDEYGPLSGGAAVALVRGKSPLETLAILGADREIGPAPAEEVREWAAAQDYQEYGTALEAELLGEWTLSVELNGFRATDSALVQQLSKGGEAVVIYNNVNALMRFMYARDGKIVRDFDPLLDPSDEATDRLPEERGITFPGENGELHPMPGAYLLAERLTGIPLGEATLTDASTRIAVGIRP
jgi:hypothetical protein